MKTCTKCKARKFLDEFATRRASRDGLTPNCKECRTLEKRAQYQEDKQRYLQRAKAWGLRNADKKRASNRKHERKHKLKQNYGMTLEGYDKLLASQGGTCAICKGPPTGRGLTYHVDHNHETATIRGLLCSSCNVSLGHMKDSPERLRKAAEYLERFSAK